MNQDKLLEQLRLAKEAGTKAMAKDFFAPTPGSGDSDSGAEGSPEEEASESPDEAKAEGDAPMGGGSAEIHAQTDQLTPEQLEELLKMLGAQDGGAP